MTDVWIPPPEEEGLSPLTLTAWRKQVADGTLEESAPHAHCPQLRALELLEAAGAACCCCKSRVQALGRRQDGYMEEKVAIALAGPSLNIRQRCLHQK